MYTVLLNNSIILHDPWPGSRIKAVGRIRKAVNSIDALDLTLYPGNPGYDSLVPLLSKIYVYNDDGDPVFIGRVLKPTGSMDSTGEIKRSFVCEGELGYLCDTVQKYRTVGTTYYFFEKVLEQHNSQVTSDKQISLGTVTVSKGYHQRTWGYTTSFKAISDYISDYGGEIRLRYDENGNRFLDYTDTAFSSASTTPIELAVNMISASYTVDPTKIASGIFAAGKKLNDDGTTAERLELDDVIWDNTLVSLYGKVVACETWDDVTTKAALEDKAEAWLDGQTAEITQYTITAAQMYELSYNFDSFEVGMTYPVINPLIGLDDTVRCVSMDIDINDPTKTTMTFGDRYTTIAQAIASTSNRSQQIAKLDSSVSSMNSSIGNLKQSTGELATQVSGLSGDVSSLSSSVSSINTRLTAAEEAISHISTDVIYSTDERKIGSWIDGDDIYEKTVVIPALGDGATRSVQAAHGIDNLGEVVESRGMLLSSGAFRPLQAIPIGSDGTSVIPESGTSYSVGRTSITVTCGTDDMSGCKAYITLRYTKKLLPDWLPDQSNLTALLESITAPSDFYLDVAYQFSNVPSRPYAFFRCYASKNMTVSWSKPSNYYSAYEKPYDSSYRGWTTYAYYYATNTTPPGWYLAGTVSNKDHGETEHYSVGYAKKALVATTFSSVLNETGESDWEDYT